MWHWMRRGLAATVALLLATAAAGDGGLPRAELTAGFHRIEAEVAATQAERSRGLMGRTMLAPNQGMLFVFPVTATHCFWMKNTPLPLSIAFLDEAGRIINVDEMAPQTEDNHCPRQPARYALEMNAGWFAVRGLQPGTRIGGLERVPGGR